MGHFSPFLPDGEFFHKIWLSRTPIYRPITPSQVLEKTNEPMNYSNFIFCSVFKFHFRYCLRQSPRLFQSKLCTGNHMSVANYPKTNLGRNI